MINWDAATGSSLASRIRATAVRQVAEGMTPERAAWLAFPVVGADEDREHFAAWLASHTRESLRPITDAIDIVR